DEARPRPPAAVPVHVDERARRTGGRGLRLQDQLAHEQLAVVVRGAVRTGSRRALAVGPGGRQLGRGEAVVDAVYVGAAVPDRAHDLSGQVVALAGGRAGLRHARLPCGTLTGAAGRAHCCNRRGAMPALGIVLQVHPADAVPSVGIVVVATVRTRIARIGVFGHLVVARLRVRRVYDADAAADLVDARAEAAEDVHEEGRDDEAGLVAASLRPPGDAAVRVARHLASRDAGACRVRVPARDADAVLASREAARRPYREDRLDASREGHDLAVGGDPRELEAHGVHPGRAPALRVVGAGAEAVRRRVGRAPEFTRRAV